MLQHIIPVVYMKKLFEKKIVVDATNIGQTPTNKAIPMRPFLFLRYPWKPTDGFLNKTAQLELHPFPISDIPAPGVREYFFLRAEPTFRRTVI